MAQLREQGSAKMYSSECQMNCGRLAHRCFEGLCFTCYEDLLDIPEEDPTMTTPFRFPPCSCSKVSHQTSTTDFSFPGPRFISPLDNRTHDRETSSSTCLFHNLDTGSHVNVRIVSDKDDVCDFDISEVDGSPERKFKVPRHFSAPARSKSGKVREGTSRPDTPTPSGGSNENDTPTTSELTPSSGRDSPFTWCPEMDMRSMSCDPEICSDELYPPLDEPLTPHPNFHGFAVPRRIMTGRRASSCLNQSDSWDRLARQISDVSLGSMDAEFPYVYPRSEWNSIYSSQASLCSLTRCDSVLSEISTGSGLTSDTDIPSFESDGEETPESDEKGVKKENSHHLPPPRPFSRMASYRSLSNYDSDISHYDLSHMSRQISDSSSSNTESPHSLSRIILDFQVNPDEKKRQQNSIIEASTTPQTHTYHHYLSPINSRRGKNLDFTTNEQCEVVSAAIQRAHQLVRQFSFQKRVLASLDISPSPREIGFMPCVDKIPPMNVTECDEEEVESAPVSVREVEAQGQNEPRYRKRKRCHVCRKKLGLTGIECRCGGIFCGLHRYSDTHECYFDYKKMGSEQIRKDNPVVVGEKVRKI